MIEKWFCLRCDNCGEVINYWQEESARAAIGREKYDIYSPVIASWNGRCFCNWECREQWLEKRKAQRKRLKQIKEDINVF